jgi:hypothetical protein
MQRWITRVPFIFRVLLAGTAEGRYARAPEFRRWTRRASLEIWVGDIYDAVLEPHLWIGVLEMTARFVGGSAASIFWRRSLFRHDYRIQPPSLG